MNKKRHKLLGILALEYANGQGFHDSILDIIVTVPTILKKLNITFDEFVIMSQELLTKKEIKYFGEENYFDQPALYSLPDGITAYANKKYLKIDKEKHREDIKFWAQLILPVLSFIIAAIALFLNLKTQTDVNTVKDVQRIENLKGK